MQESSCQQMQLVARSLWPKLGEKQSNTMSDLMGRAVKSLVTLLPVHSGNPGWAECPAKKSHALCHNLSADIMGMAHNMHCMYCSSMYAYLIAPSLSFEPKADCSCLHPEMRKRL